MNSGTVLIADDHAAIRKSLELLLTSEGVHCITACDGEQAWELYKSQAPSLLLIDYRMPKLNGIDLLEKVREEDLKTPVFIISADRELEKKTQGCLASQVIRKPYDIIQLLGLIKQTLASDQSSQFLIKNDI